MYEPYIEVLTKCRPEEAELTAYCLLENGALGTEERETEDPQQVIVIGYFSHTADISGERLRSALQIIPGCHFVSVTQKENINWFKNRHIVFPPLQITDTIVVIPEWEKELDGKITVRIRPGMAFGTGNHATTKLALVLLEKTAREFPGKSFIEIGTGSGVLAIAGIKLGLSAIAVCDIQPEAKEEFRYNCGISGITRIPDFVCGGPEQITCRADLILANMTAEELRPLFSQFIRLGAAADTQFIFSGIHESVKEHFYHELVTWFHIHEETRLDDWFAFRCSKR